MRPNIFNYATCELSQDAVICWMLDWANSEDTVMKDFAIKFIRAMLDIHQYDFLDLNNLERVEIERQHYSIDVLVLLYFNDGVIMPIIIEDKTYTTEHGNQLKKYYDNILKENKGNEKIASPIGIYYKTGFIYDYENIKIENAGYKIFSRTMILDLLKKYIGKVESDIFNNYYDYLMSIELKEEKFRNIINTDDMDNMSQLLDTNEGQWILIRKIFGSSQKPYRWNGTSRGKPWTQWVVVEQFEKKELWDSIYYRLDWRSKGYFLSLKQYLDYENLDSCNHYLNETNEVIIIEDKMIRLDRLKRCFQSALENMKARGIEVLETGEISNRGAKESEFGVFYINKKNSFSKMIDFFPNFNKILEEKIQNEFKF